MLLWYTDNKYGKQSGVVFDFKWVLSVKDTWQEEAGSRSQPAYAGGEAFARITKYKFDKAKVNKIEVVEAFGITIFGVQANRPINSVFFVFFN